MSGERSTDDIEHEIKSVDVVLRLLRTDCAAADTMEGKLCVQKHTRYIESIRATLRKELFTEIDKDAP